jgi:hypothetical protein
MGGRGRKGRKSKKTAVKWLFHEQNEWGKRQNSNRG